MHLLSDGNCFDSANFESMPLRHSLGPDEIRNSDDGSNNYTNNRVTMGTVLKSSDPSDQLLFFQVMSNDGSITVGRISKQWTGLAQEFFTDADNFGIEFPMNLDVRLKAVLLGAVMLIVSTTRLPLGMPP